MNHTIRCTGQHTTVPELGTLTLPDTAPDWQVANALGGYLCADCGAAYRLLVWVHAAGEQLPALASVDAEHGIPPHTTPNAAQVNAALAHLGRTRTLDV